MPVNLGRQNERVLNMVRQEEPVEEVLPDDGRPRININTDGLPEALRGPAQAIIGSGTPILIMASGFIPYTSGAVAVPTAPSPEADLIYLRQNIVHLSLSLGNMERARVADRDAFRKHIIGLRQFRFWAVPALVFSFLFSVILLVAILERGKLAERVGEVSDAVGSTE